MTKSDRPSLSSLPLTRKPPPPSDDKAVDVTAAEPPAEPALPRKPKGKADDKVVLMVRVSRADRKKIRQIAVATDTTVQAIVEESVQDILRRHRVRPIS